MASIATPYGLRPINQIGGQPFNGGGIREFRMAANNAAAIFNGDLVVLSTAGQPAAVAASPVGTVLAATSVPATAGIVGVCVGCRYISSEGQFRNNHFVPANLITGGASDVWVAVVDDPDTLFQIKGTAALGTFNSGTAGSGWPGAIGKNAALNFDTAGLVTTGNSGVALATGTNGNGLVTNSDRAVRIVDFVRGTEEEAYPEFIVKFNVGVHSYQNSLGV
jgi:hypothetical protein